MHRWFAAARPLALLVALACGLAFLVEESRAELDSSVFTSPSDRLRMVVPRGWRATDQPSYPGLILWMMRSQPPGQIVLTSEAFTRELYCAWPITCRQTPDSVTAQFACALRTRLAAQRLRVGPAQPGPRETQAAGLPTLWFEYDDGKRYLRQAVSIANERAISLVLCAPTGDARASHVRPFDQALRTLRYLTVDETTAAPAEAVVSDAGVSDASPTAPADATTLDGGVVFESAPAPKLEPVGPCPK